MNHTNNISHTRALGFVLSLSSGVLIILQGVFLVIRSRWILEMGIGAIRRHSLNARAFGILGAVTVVLGLTIILGAYLLHNPKNERQGAVTVIAFSALSIFTGGGYLVGLLLGVIGGTLVLSKNEAEQSTKNGFSPFVSSRFIRRVGKENRARAC
jgi:hypothetical protein